MSPESLLRRPIWPLWAYSCVVWLFSHAMAAEEPARPAALTGEVRILAILEEPTELEFVATPLTDVFQYLRKRHSIEIQIDKRAWDDAGITTDTPVSIHVSGVRLRSALNLILAPYELTWVVESNVLLISTGEVTDCALTTEVYPIADLQQLERSEPFAEDALASIIPAIVAPAYWQRLGGPGSIRSAPGALIVYQAQVVHEQIAQLLADLRGVRGGKSPAEDAARKREAAIQRALAQEVQVEFVETPLRGAMQFLQDGYHVPIVLDEKALDDVGVPTDLPLTYEFKAVSLKNALDLMLRESLLTWMIRDDVLMITTKEVAESSIEVRLYDVADLTVGEAAAWNMELLGSVLSTMIEPPTWGNVGGPGEVRALPGILVVSQTRVVHDEIARLLAQLRRLPAVAAAPEQMVPRWHRVANGSVDDLAKIIPQVVSPDQWAGAGGDGTIHAVHGPTAVTTTPQAATDAAEKTPPTSTATTTSSGWLLIRQTPTVHEQIERLLNAMTGGAPF